MQSYQISAPTLTLSSLHDAARRVPLWPTIALCFFAMSSGSVTLAGLPRTFVLSLPTALIMLMILQFRLHRIGIAFAACFLTGYIPGTVNSLADGTLDFMSLANLMSSVCLFTIVFSYSTALPKSNIDRKIDYIFALLAIISVVEIFFYQQVLSIRYIYYGDVIADHSSRDAILYGISRPTAFFSEPSNFARFLSLLLLLHLVTLRKAKRTGLWFLTFVILVRSPVLFYAAPAMALVLLQQTTTLRINKSGLSKGLRRILVVLFAVLMLAGAAAFQQERIRDVLEGTEGSFTGRLELPAQFMLDFWEHQITGDGPTPNDKINEVVNALFIAAGRDWLEGEEFRIGLAPTLVIIIGMGAFGVALFFISAALALGRKGLWMVGVFLLINLLGTGTNAPAMFVPSAIVMALLWSTAIHVVPSPYCRTTVLSTTKQ